MGRPFKNAGAQLNPKLHTCLGTVNATANKKKKPPDGTVAVWTNSRDDATQKGGLFSP